METSGLDELKFERIGPVKRALKVGISNPLVNWIIPAGFLRWLLRVTKSEMAAASWENPGGWKSMVLSYREEKPPQVADRLLIKLGSVPIALRNRKRLVVEIFTRILNAREGETTNIVALGAGPGLNTLEAMARSGHPDAHAWMIDLNPDSFNYGREQAEQLGIRDRVKYVEGDVTDYRKLIDAQPHLVEMIGICEYLPDETVIDIARAIGDVMPSGCYLVANSISYRHGTDRFFRRVFDLNMAHRTPQRISEMLAEGGIETLHVVPEPLGVYHVLICRKK